MWGIREEKNLKYDVPKHEKSEEKTEFLILSNRWYLSFCDSFEKWIFGFTKTRKKN